MILEAGSPLLGVWLVAYDHLQLYHIDSAFFLTFGTE